MRRAAIIVGLGCFGLSLAAQTSGPTEHLQGLKVIEIHPLGTPSPFPLDAKTKTVQTLEFRPLEQMTQADRELAVASQAEILRRAGLVGFHFDAGQDFAKARAADASGKWGYEQAVCPAFPGHLILEFSRIDSIADGGAGNYSKPGDVSLFAAVIPRGSGHVRVIPAQRRSYSLFTPASSNALTINDFNHTVSEEGTGLDPDWLMMGLCYTALASGHVRAGVAARVPADEVYPLVMAARLKVSRKGGAEVRFADNTAGVRSMNWALLFAQSGQLLKAKHFNSVLATEKPVKGAVVEVKSVPTRQRIVDVPPVP